MQKSKKSCIMTLEGKNTSVDDLLCDRSPHLLAGLHFFLRIYGCCNFIDGFQSCRCPSGLGKLSSSIWGTAQLVHVEPKNNKTTW
jgi:hypothetical protein